MLNISIKEAREKVPFHELTKVLENYDPAEMDFLCIHNFCDDTVKTIAIELVLLNPGVLELKAVQLVKNHSALHIHSMLPEGQIPEDKVIFASLSLHIVEVVNKSLAETFASILNGSVHIPMHDMSNSLSRYNRNEVIKIANICKSQWIKYLNQ